MQLPCQPRTTPTNSRGGGRSTICPIPRRQRQLVRASPDDEEPVVLGDWRSVRAKLVSDERRSSWANSISEENQRLLEIQNPKLAQEDVWAHPTGAPERGGVLLATPDAHKVMNDGFLWQLVILLVQHSDEGSVGLIQNRPSGLVMGLKQGGLPFQILGAPDGMQSAFSDNRVYAGGYTRQDIFQVLHPHKLQGSMQVIPGVHLGGEAEAVAAVAAGDLPAADFKFFSGAMVWGPGQLMQEVDKGLWYTAAASRPLVLKQCLQLPKPLWREIMELMGGEHAQIAKQEARYLGDE